ncbi:MAG: hypothetical protein JO217_11315 [Acidobacteriaceae bacterium]|nr:hypothetical protein [Acidobacteriaceae bacterium]
MRKQLALFQEREKKAAATAAADRFVFCNLARFFDSAQRLGDCQTSHLDRLASNCVPPLLALEIETRRPASDIGRGAALNSSNGSRKSHLGEERIADELWLKLQVRLSRRTIRKYIEQAPRPHGSKDQGWSTFIRNHANGIVACDFFVSVTVGFRILYIFVALEMGSRRLLHFNLTEHPTSEWTLQQLREALPGDQDYNFLLHDRHKTFSASFDETVESCGIHALRSPVRMPTANAYCERLIGSIRRECLDYLIPLKRISFAEITS